MSTEEQAQEGISIEAQKEYCKAWADRMGWTRTWFYADRGCSGKDRERPLLKKMMGDALIGWDPVAKTRDTTKTKFDMVQVYNNNRLSRDVKDTLSILDELAKVGVPVKFGIISNVDLATPEGRFLLTNLAAGAEFYRRDIAQKTKMSMGVLKGRGKHLGRPPWGFKIAEDGILAIVDQRVTAIWLRAYWPPHLGVTRISRDLGMNPRTVEAVVKVRPRVLEAWEAAGVTPQARGFNPPMHKRPES